MDCGVEGNSVFA